MNIAVIDPGQSTGLVIAYFKEYVDHVFVVRKTVKTISTPSEAVALARSARCRMVLMEQKPLRPSKEGLEPWERIFQSLVTQHRYRLAKDLNYTFHKTSSTLFLVQPSSWKPFMKRRSDISRSGTTQHEKDAMGMLHYFIQTNHPEKGLIYG